MTAAAHNVEFQARRIRRLDDGPQTRDVRVVHELDGILGAVEPTGLLATGTTLWRAWARHRAFTIPDVLIGLDAGGILPTVAVALASDLPYRLAWKLDLDLPHKHRFSEHHARRREVFAYGDLAGTQVLLVDDEVTSGNTLASLVRTLREADAEVVGAACLVEDTTDDARSLLRCATTSALNSGSACGCPLSGRPRRRSLRPKGHAPSTSCSSPRPAAPTARTTGLRASPRSRTSWRSGVPLPGRSR